MPLGKLPENLEKVADAGGWDARAMEQAKEFMKEASKIKPNQWKGINENLKIVKDIVDVNMEGFATQMIDNITTNVKLEIEAALSPITNEINTAIAEQLAPFIAEIMPIINDLGSFLAENKTGAAVGGIIGGVAGKFLPGGTIVGGIVGALIGALVESGYALIGDIIAQAPPDAPYQPNLAELYTQETGNPYLGIFDWSYIAWYNDYIARTTNTFLPTDIDYRTGR